MAELRRLDAALMALAETNEDIMFLSELDGSCTVITRRVWGVWDGIGAGPSGIWYMLRDRLAAQEPAPVLAAHTQIQLEITRIRRQVRQQKGRGTGDVTQVDGCLVDAAAAGQRVAAASDDERTDLLARPAADLLPSLGRV